MGPVLEAIRALSAARDRYRYAFAATHDLGTTEITALTHLLSAEQTTAGQLAARARIAQRLLAMTAAIWHNRATSQPLTRSLIAYDH